MPKDWARQGLPSGSHSALGRTICQASAKSKSLLCLPSPGVKPAARKVSQSWGHKWWELSIWSRSEDGLTHLLTFPQRALNSMVLPYRCELTLGPIGLMSPTVCALSLHSSEPCHLVMPESSLPHLSWKGLQQLEDMCSALASPCEFHIPSCLLLGVLVRPLWALGVRTSLGPQEWTASGENTLR